MKQTNVLRRVTQKEFNDAYKRHQRFLRAIHPGEGHNRMKFEHCDMRDVDVYGAGRLPIDLNFACFAHSSFVGCDWHRSDKAEDPPVSIIGASFRATDFSFANLCNLEFRNADMSMASFDNASFVSSTLCNMSFMGASFKDANLAWTVLCGSNLMGADLSYASLVGANMGRVVVDDTTTLGPRPALPSGPLTLHKVVRTYGKHPDVAIARLRVPARAGRVLPYTSNDDVRVSCATVDDITTLDGQKTRGGLTWSSTYDRAFTYRVGEKVTPDSWDPDPFERCTFGIHAYVRREDAVDYARRVKGSNFR